MCNRTNENNSHVRNKLESGCWKFNLLGGGAEAVPEQALKSLLQRAGPGIIHTSVFVTFIKLKLRASEGVGEGNSRMQEILGEKSTWTTSEAVIRSQGLLVCASPSRLTTFSLYSILITYPFVKAK